jgi:pimeloyl-ACP methyl ester carboxylesterase
LYCLQGPYASAANDEKISKAAWKGKPSWFIYGENDQMLLKELERDSATKMGAKTLVLPSSHVPMLSHPAEVANFIETAARAMGEASNSKAGHNTRERGSPAH